MAEYLARRPLKIILQDDKVFENPYSTLLPDSPNVHDKKISPRDRYLLDKKKDGTDGYTNSRKFLFTSPTNIDNVMIQMQ